MQAYDLIAHDQEARVEGAAAVAEVAEDLDWRSLTVRQDLVDRCRLDIAGDRYETDDRYDLAITRLATLLN